MSSLTTRTTLGIMPLAIGILLRHYYDRALKDKNKRKNEEGAAVPVPLRLEELMYDEAFTITRVSSTTSPPSLRLSQSHPHTRQNFMDSATKYVPLLTFSCDRLSCDASHTVEELQHFTQLHTPVGPSSHVVRLAIPQSCCAEAARVLVRALGGEREARRVVGGVRWWQVRPGDRGYVACLFFFCFLPVFDGCTLLQDRRGVDHG